MVENSRLALPELSEQIKDAFQQWDKPYREASPLIESLLFREVNPGPVKNPRSALNRLLLELLDHFQGDETRFADTLRMRYGDGRTVRETANYFNVEEGTVQKRQAAGWEEAARIFQQKEQALLNEIHQRLFEKLESPTYSQLWGVDEHIQTLTDLITDPDGPQIIAIEGIGGIGKTSLTNALMRHLIETDVIGHGQFMGCAWVTARRTSLSVGGLTQESAQPILTSHALIDGICGQLFTEEGRPIGLEPEQLFSMLKHRLAEQPHLIVVDNLETVEDVAVLFETLRQLIGPTRIVLTTRQNLFNEPDVYHFAIPSLSEAYALELVRAEAHQRNLALLAKASDDELRPIYKTVGGNPLALRLVVGQTHIHALQDVLADLTAAQGKPIENLYTHIYWLAWNALDEAAREAWLLMPIANGEGLNLSHLADIAEIPSPDLRNALDQLVTLNLVDRRGDLTQSRYTIHPLTRTFLQNQVLKWGEKVPA